jgi:uncharacterized protein (TIGR00369 family)
MGCPLLDSLSHRSYDDADAHVVELDIADEIRGPSGAVHGGIVASLIDRAGAFVAVRASGRPVATSSANVHYLAAARRGPLRARAKSVRSGRHHGVVEVEIDDTGTGKAGRLVAKAVLTFQYLDGDQLVPKIG